MKKEIKKFLPAIILAFAMAFMTFIFEPITMYANNTNDFWFDFYTLIRPTGLFFLILFAGMMGGFLVVYLIAKKLKKEKLYYLSLLIVSYGFIVFYIHSNYLAGFLPSLDGETIDYSGFLPNFLSILVLLLCLVGIIILVKKVRLEKGVKIVSYVNLAIVAMLGVSLLSTFLTTPVLEAKEILASSTVKNLNTASTNENFFIFLVDAVDSTHFNKVVQSDEEYQKTFRDFSYFPDTVSGYAFTRDSVPFIFSGKWYENEKPFAEYSTEAFDNSPLFNKLAEKNFNRNIYNVDFVWRSRKALEFDNVDSIEKNVKLGTFFKQELKYLMFKFFPYPLKRFSSIQSMNFNWAQRRDEYDSYGWGDVYYYNTTLEQPVEKTNEKMFKYIHLEGGHVPYDVDEDVQLIPDESGTYPEKLVATMKIIKKYLERLKANGVYDNSTIVILADHGFWFEGTNRQNPILYIKGKGETHSEMIESKKQISYEDLAEAFVELLDGKNSEEIFKEVPEDGRVRRYIYNGFNHEEHMVEYELKGEAWDATALVETGREFNL